MDKDTALKVISRFRDAIEGHGVRVKRIVLFGSYAEGNYHEGSDIDLVVISDDFADKDYWQRIDILSDAIYEVFEPIEAVAATTQEWQNGDSLILQYARRGEFV